MSFFLQGTGVPSVLSLTRHRAAIFCPCWVSVPLVLTKKCHAATFKFYTNIFPGLKLRTYKFSCEVSYILQSGKYFALAGYFYYWF
jgi:hypothetical protein